jgi:hypothetical protein
MVLVLDPFRLDEITCSTTEGTQRPSLASPVSNYCSYPHSLNTSASHCSQPLGNDCLSHMLQDVHPYSTCTADIAIVHADNKESVPLTPDRLPIPQSSVLDMRICGLCSNSADRVALT